MEYYYTIRTILLYNHTTARECFDAIEKIEYYYTTIIILLQQGAFRHARKYYTINTITSYNNVTAKKCFNAMSELLSMP